MKNIRIYDEEDRLLDELNVLGNFGIVYGKSGTGVECYDRFMERMPYTEQFVYCQVYQQRVEELKERYFGRLMRVEPKRIAFAVDEHWKFDEKNTSKTQEKIDISKAGKLFAFGDKFDYIIHMRRYWLERWSDAQINAAIMSQLLLINPKGGLSSVPADAANPLVATFGAGYLEPKTMIPDLLKEHVYIREFRRADGQMTVDDIEPSGTAEPDAARTAGVSVCGECIDWRETSGGMGVCGAEMADGPIADSRPACGEFDPGIPIPDDIGGTGADEDGDGHDDAA